MSDEEAFSRKDSGDLRGTYSLTSRISEKEWKHHG